MSRAVLLEPVQDVVSTRRRPYIVMALHTYGPTHVWPYEQYSWSLFKMLYQLVGGEEMLVSGIGLSCEEITGWCTRAFQKKKTAIVRA